MSRGPKSSVIGQLTEKQLASPPRWLPNAVVYETQMGSVAYGVSSDTSDYDVCGFCIPPKELVFPHLAGEIPGFGKPAPRFEQFQQHHILDPDALGGTGRQYDVTIFSLVKFFDLAMQGNPTVVEALFTPVTCVLHTTAIGERVRSERRAFLHRGAWARFKGYAYAQMHKMDVKTPQPGSRRAENVEQFGFDVKFAYHIVRLLDEAEQIITLGDIDIQRDRERLKAIRRGEWTIEQIRNHFEQKERDLEALLAQSPLPAGPDEVRIKRLLLECLEMHWGSLGNAVIVPDQERQLLREIKQLCEKAGV